MRRLTTEEFIRRAREVHGGRYDYSSANYRNNRTKIEIVCPEHGSFWQTPNDHLSGKGCVFCGRERMIEKRSLSLEVFVNRARAVHGERYDYSRAVYRTARTKVEIICPEHGSFWQTPDAHLRGQGCPVCARGVVSSFRRFSVDDFIERAREVHGDRYDYSKVIYLKSSEKVEIVCPKHGSFWQTPNNHISQKQDCPRCTTRISRPEQELADTIKSWGYDIIQGHRGWCGERPKLEIDIYIPSLETGIEFNGDYWHARRSDGYHEDKLKLAGEAGISLVMVWESEWVKDRRDILRFLREFLEEKERCVA